jgi:uronate dehydrogenase
VPCDLADGAPCTALLQGVQAVVHLGGVSVEGPFEPILQANIVGLHHLYEAARRRACGASSSPAATTSPAATQAQTIAPTRPPRPDGNYGLSKLFGEGLASLYWDRYGIETVCLRIGTATPSPPDRRGLATWLSLPDLVRLVMRADRAGRGLHRWPTACRPTPRASGARSRLGAPGLCAAGRRRALPPQVQHLLQPEGPQRGCRAAVPGHGPLRHPA